MHKSVGHIIERGSHDAQTRNSTRTVKVCKVRGDTKAKRNTKNVFKTKEHIKKGQKKHVMAREAGVQFKINLFM